MPRYLSVCQNSLAQQSCLNTNSPETIKARTTSWHIHLRTEKPHVYHKKICTRLKEGPRSIDWRVCSACLTLCDPVDCSPPGSSVHGILQATALEWVAVHFSRGSPWPRDQTCVSCVFCIGRWILYHYATWEVQPLTCRMWCYLQVGRVRIELNWTASWYCRIIWCGERTHTHLGTSLVVQGLKLHASTAEVQLVWSLIR